jgi:hypothetical protein
MAWGSTPRDIPLQDLRMQANATVMLTALKILPVVLGDKARDKSLPDKKMEGGKCAVSFVICILHKYFRDTKLRKARSARHVARMGR